MNKITFKRQVFIGIILIVVGNVLALILHKGVLANIAWILYGLVLILHPIYPERYSNDVKSAKLGFSNCRNNLYFGRNPYEIYFVNFRFYQTAVIFNIPSFITLTADL